METASEYHLQKCIHHVLILPLLSAVENIHLQFQIPGVRQ